MRKIILFIVSLIVFFGIPPTYAASSPSVSLTPSIVRLLLIPGKQYQTQFTIVNNSEKSLAFRVQFEPFMMDDETGTTQFNTSPGIHSWSTVDQSELLLAPKSQRTITVTTTIPQKVDLGGYASMLFFTAVAPEKNITVQTQLGAFITADIALNERVTDADIQTLSPFSFQFVESTTPLTFGIQNESLSHLNAQPIIQLSSWGVQKKSIQLEEKFIFPGRTRQWKTEIQFKPWRPYYTVTIIAVLGGGIQIARNIIVFPIPVYMLVGISSVIIVVGMLIRRRKYIRKALRALYE